MKNFEAITRHIEYCAETLNAVESYGGSLQSRGNTVQMQFVFPASLYLADLGFVNYKISFRIRKSFFEKYFSGKGDYEDEKTIMDFFFTDKKLPLCFALHTNLMCLISSRSQNFQKKLFVESYLMFMLYQVTVVQDCRADMNQCENCPIKIGRQRIKSVQDWIDNNFAQNINLHDLSYQFSIPSDGLNLLFERYTGCNIYDYILRKRMLHANFLMQNSMYSFEQIAQQSGYSGRTTLLKAYENYFLRRAVLVLRN